MTGLLFIIKRLSKDKSLKTQGLMKVGSQELLGSDILKSQNAGISLFSSLDKVKLPKLTVQDRSIKEVHQIQEPN